MGIELFAFRHNQDKLRHGESHLALKASNTEIDIQIYKEIVAKSIIILLIRLTTNLCYRMHIYLISALIMTWPQPNFLVQAVMRSRRIHTPVRKLVLYLKISFSLVVKMYISAQLGSGNRRISSKNLNITSPEAIASPGMNSSGYTSVRYHLKDLHLLSVLIFFLGETSP